MCAGPWKVERAGCRRIVRVGGSGSGGCGSGDPRFGQIAIERQAGRLADSYPIASIEDPLSEDDIAGTVEFTRRIGERVQIIGDDYIVTNAALVRDAQDQGACNAALIKVNQPGTVSESLETSMPRAPSGGGNCLCQIGRDGGCFHQPSAIWQPGWGRAVGGRLLHPLGTHGQMERMPAHSGHVGSLELRGRCTAGRHMVRQEKPTEHRSMKGV